MSSSQSSIVYADEEFKQYLLKILSTIVWKNPTLAQSFESTDTNELYRIELFITANRDMLSWETIMSFPRVVLRNAGIPDDLIEKYATFKSEIPVDLRAQCVAEYKKALTSKNPVTGHYEYYDVVGGEWVDIVNEKNNYYRTLAGLPYYGDNNPIYNDDPRWPIKPIHELPIADRYEMEKEGVLDRICKEHPNVVYLQYCGSRAVDLFKSRTADNYEILYAAPSGSTDFDKDFRDAYNQCKYLTMSVYFNKALQKSNDLYDNFLAMSIAFMTIEVMQTKYLECDTSRDFYSVEAYKTIYDSYSVPFYREIPLEYHKKIVKNINKLISNKGSSQVFFDLFKLFDYSEMILNQYYLVKRHKVDSHGNPTFIIAKDRDGNDLYDEDGNPVLAPENYELYFSKADIYGDPSLSISDRDNDIDYNQFIMADPYWVNDDALVSKLQNENFNYIETKYIGIQSVVDLMKVSFENAYVFRMITDNKEFTQKIELDLSDLHLKCTLFDLFIYLAALFCLGHGYQGTFDTALNIPDLMDTLGYDFNQSITRVRESINERVSSVDNERIRYLIMNMNPKTLDGINSSYDNIVELRNLIYEGYCNAKTPEEFFAYRELYNSILISKESSEVYRNPNTGEMFTWFQDMLSYYSPDLYARFISVAPSAHMKPDGSYEYDEVNEELVEEEMTIISSIIEQYLTSMRYLPFSIGLTSNRIIESLFKILSFFKSAKAELLGYNLMYVITSRGVTFFKLLDKIIRYTYNAGPVPDYQILVDAIHDLHHLEQLVDYVLKMKDEPLYGLHTYQLEDQIRFLSDAIIMYKELITEIMSDEFFMKEFLVKTSEKQNFKSDMKLTDSEDAELIKLISVGYRYYEEYKDTSVFTDFFKQLSDHSYHEDLALYDDGYDSLGAQDALFLQTKYGLQRIS